MVHNWKIALTIISILGAASASLAQDIRLPKIDLQKLCKQNDAAVRSVLSDVSQDFVSNCVADEQGARDEIVKEWATFPAVARARCVRPDEYLPTYVEWLTCLRMTRDVLKEHKENAVPAAAVSSGAR